MNKNLSILFDNLDDKDLVSSYKTKDLTLSDLFMFRKIINTLFDKRDIQLEMLDGLLLIRVGALDLTFHWYQFTATVILRIISRLGVDDDGEFYESNSIEINPHLMEKFLLSDDPVSFVYEYLLDLAALAKKNKAATTA